MAFLRDARAAARGITLDQDLLERLPDRGYVRRHRAVAFLTSPGIRAGFLIRLTTAGTSRLAAVLGRNLLVSWFASDVNPAARLEGAIHLPHPVGIVIGTGVVVGDGARIYQHVTLGTGRGGYPRVGRDATILPAAIVVGGITIGDGARVAAAAFVNSDVPAGTTRYR